MGRITGEQRERVLSMLATGEASQSRIAAETGVRPVDVQQIADGRYSLGSCNTLQRDRWLVGKGVIP